MKPWWWSLIAIAIIILSVLLAFYVESRIKKYRIIERHDLAAQLTVVFVVLLWLGLLAGIYLGKILIP